MNEAGFNRVAVLKLELVAPPEAAAALDRVARAAVAQFGGQYLDKNVPLVVSFPYEHQAVECAIRVLQALEGSVVRAVVDGLGPTSVLSAASGLLLKQLHAALLEAFPDYGKLRELVRFEL